MISRNSLGNIYPIKKLGDLADFLDSRRKPVKECDRVIGPYPYYGANGLQGWINDFLFDEDLILLAEDGGHFDNPDRGVAYKISGKTWVNNHAHVIKPKEGVDLDYLCRVLENYDLTPWITGTTRGKLTKGGASEIRIPLPPLAEQRRIASILDQADELRQKRQQAIEKLDQLLQATFIDMFGDPVSNPKGWDLGKLGDLGTLDRGISKHRPRGAPELLGGIHPLIQTGDVARSQGYIRTFTSTYSDLGLAQSKKWAKGTLCITIAANIANTGILTFEACFPDSVVGFTANQTSNVEFVQGLFLFFKQILEEKAPQSAQKNINLAILRDLEIPIPPQDLQEKWSKIALSIEDQKQNLYKQLDMQNQLFSSLQNQAFNGTL